MQELLFQCSLQVKLLLFTAVWRRGLIGPYSEKWLVRPPFFGVKSADKCNNSYWSFSLLNLTGGYDKKLKELEQEVSTDVADYCPIIIK